MLRKQQIFEQEVLMRLSSKKAIFGLSLLAGFLFVLGTSGYGYWQRQPRAHISLLAEDIGLSDQIVVDDVPKLAVRGYATIIDLRPDGEAPDQPSSREINAAALETQLQFHYIPVPHGDAVPANTVAALGKAMESSPKPILLYCRSGRRAARAWSLAEAARPNGLEADAIKATVKAGGHSIDDLIPAINARIASRSKRQGV
jgi:uncharacterized protein (TIGR01244 family)